MQVFISQPMAGLSELQIFDMRNKICNKFHINDEEIIENYRKDGIPKEDVNQRVWCLGDSIRLMAFADLVIFAPGWERAAGCAIEHEICLQYGIPILELHKL